MPKAEIAENGYDLSINHYKEIVYEEVEYGPPQLILDELGALEAGPGRIAGDAGVGRRRINSASGTGNVLKDVGRPADPTGFSLFPITDGGFNRCYTPRKVKEVWRT
ncbi:MAG: hypothetical protein KDD92_02585 [Caldilineaceae bacterium]|nr:hypothetical protein [Caldilineaceae bacterium]